MQPQYKKTELGGSQCGLHRETTFGGGKISCFFKCGDETVTAFCSVVLCRMVVIFLKNNLLLLCVCMMQEEGVREQLSGLVSEAGSLLFPWTVQSSNGAVLEQRDNVSPRYHRLFKKAQHQVWDTFFEGILYPHIIGCLLGYPQTS